MRIEKINENQIRCTLSKEELADRQIKMSELAYGSEKAKSLFRDMIEQANYEFGFEAEDIPLMIEAIPLSGEKIILQITKVEYPEEIDTRFSKFSESEEEEETVAEGNLFPETQGADDILGIFKKMQEDLQQQVEDKEKQVDKQSATEVKALTESAKPVNLTKMFEFVSLEQLGRLAHVLGGYYEGENDLYKDEKKNRFYLILRKGQHTPEEFNKVCNIISEYSVQKKYSPATEAYFDEHGKAILKNTALQVLGALED